MKNQRRQPSNQPAPSTKPSSSGALAGELAELARSAPTRLAERLTALSVREQAESALRLPARERLELLLHAPQPMRLVRVLPDAELYLTVREVGPSDALPLLSLASAQQIQHLIDLESWRKDRFDPLRCGAWAAVLLEAGEATLKRFLRSADDELLVLLLRKWLRLEQIELDDNAAVHGSGKSEAGDERGFVSPDGYHRFSPAIPEHGPSGQRLLQLLFGDQPQRYQRVLWSALWELPSDLEEKALKWRQSRLEEHGFPGWEEALAVYAPPTGIHVHPEPLEPLRPDGLTAPRSPLRVLAGRGLLAPATERLTGASRERVLHEIVSLANHVLVADSGEAGDPQVHRMALEKASGYINIALALRGADDDRGAARVLGEVPTLELFREGYARVAELQRRAQRLVGEDWASVHPRGLELLDPPIRPRVAGLLQSRPLYLELAEGRDENAFRDFRTLAEIEETRVSVEMAEVVGHLFVDRLALDVERLLNATEGRYPEYPRFSALLLTVLAWHSARGEVRCEPLPAEVTSDFLRNVAVRRTAGPGAPARAMEALLRSLAEKASLQPRELAVLQAFGQACLERLASECSNLDPGTPLDPRHVSCLLVAE